MAMNIRRFGALQVIVAMLVAFVLLPAGMANAAPEDGAALANSPTLPLTVLGSDPDLALYGQQGSSTLTFPVPPGMIPTSLNITSQLPVNVRTGTLTVAQEGRILARVDIPVGPPGPIVIPLDGVRVVGNAVTLLLQAYLLPIEGYCLDPTNPLRLTDITLSFAGAERPPATVAEFLPPVLRKLVIFVGAQPSQAESDAVVRIATAVVAHYGKQYPAVEVKALTDRDVPPVDGGGQFERQIVIAEGPDNGVSLYDVGGPVRALLISGAANQLTNQARLLGSDISALAVSSKAVAGPLESTPQLPADTTTIRRMGQPGVNATALNPQVGIALDQTRMGRPVHGLRVHLQGSYTPLPAAIGGQLVVTIAGQTIARWPAEATGVVDRWIDIPDRLLQRYTTLAVQVNISGPTGRCGEFQPITLTIDGDSAVQTSAASPPVPAGFQSMPQSLMPRVQIGIGPDAFADTGRAVQIMTVLQRLSALPIDTAVMPLQQAVDSPNPALLISADGWAQQGIDLPVSTSPAPGPTTLGTVDDDGNPTTLTLDPGVRFGSLQTVFDGRRALLVATSNGAAGELDRLLDYLTADVRNGSIIDGIAVLGVPGRSPIVVAGEQADGTASSPIADGRPGWVIAAGAVLLGLLVAGLAALSLRRRPIAGG